MTDTGIPKCEIAIRRLAEKFFSQPLGSLTKSEIEIMILDALICGGELQEDAYQISVKCKVTPEKAWRYLRNYHLRSDPLSERQAKSQIISLIRVAELSRDGNFFALRVTWPKLKVWIDRELMKLNLIQGESFRQDILKISGLSLCNILYGNTIVKMSRKDIDKLANEINDDGWRKHLNKIYKPEGIKISSIIDGVSKSASILNCLVGLAPVASLLRS
jgi:hypothetical protein